MNITQRDIAPGMSAIATTLAQHYGFGVQPAHWGTQSPLRQGGEDPLEGISAFWGVDHWHYVTYGLTELFEGETAFPYQPGVSGFGFELTFRLASQEPHSAPAWPVPMLQRLARYIFRSSNVFRPGDHMHLNGTIGGQKHTHIEGALFTLDPTLAPIETIHGEVRFIQLVGVTNDELNAVKDWRCEGFLELMARRNPKLVTDLGRPTMMIDQDFAEACKEGARQEGSSHGSSFASVVKWEDVGNGGLDLTIGAIAVEDLLRMLRLRLPYNRPFRLHGRRNSVRFVPALRAGWKVDGRELVLEVPWDAAAGLADSLRARRGRYPWHGIPGLTLVVAPTDVRGSRGELVRVIG